MRENHVGINVRVRLLGGFLSLKMYLKKKKKNQLFRSGLIYKTVLTKWQT